MELEISDLTVRLGLTRAPVIDRLTWTVNAFPVVLLGPNGAGKSSLLSVLSGARLAASGQVLGRMGKDAEFLASSRQWPRFVGFAPQHFRGMWGFEVRELVAYAGWLKGMSRGAAWQASEGALEVAGLAEFAERASTRLSGGELRRLALAQSVVHSPKLLLLDELEAGLDALQRRIVRASIDRLRDSTAIISATHELHAIPGSHAVAVIGSGQIVFTGSFDEFLGQAPAGTPVAELAEAAYVAVASSDRALNNAVP